MTFRFGKCYLKKSLSISSREQNHGSHIFSRLALINVRVLTMQKTATYRFSDTSSNRFHNQLAIIGATDELWFGEYNLLSTGTRVQTLSRWLSYDDVTMCVTNHTSLRQHLARICILWFILLWTLNNKSHNTWKVRGQWFDSFILIDTLYSTAWYTWFSSPVQSSDNQSLYLKGGIANPTFLLNNFGY